MGSRIIPVSELELQKSYVPETDKNLVFEDLVRTLKLDPGKYRRPEVNENFDLVKNGIYLLAAKEANLSYMIVEGPWKGQYFELENGMKEKYMDMYRKQKKQLETPYQVPNEHSPNQSIDTIANSDEIIKNHIFFTYEIQNIKKHELFLKNIFEQYFQNCKNAVENNGLISKGRIYSVIFGFPFKDVLSYSLIGKLTSPENKSLLSKPNKILHDTIDETIHPIKSINGRKYQHSN